MDFWGMTLDGFLAKYCIDLKLLNANKGNQNQTSRYPVFTEAICLH